MDLGVCASFTRSKGKIISNSHLEPDWAEDLDFKTKQYTDKTKSSLGLD